MVSPGAYQLAVSCFDEGSRQRDVGVDPLADDLDATVRPLATLRRYACLSAREAVPFGARVRRWRLAKRG